MLKKERFKVYEYPLKDKNGNVYFGSYTIKADVKPKGFKGEKIVDKFVAEVKVAI